MEIHHEGDAERVRREQALGGVGAVGVQPEVGCLEILQIQEIFDTMTPLEIWNSVTISLI